MNLRFRKNLCFFLAFAILPFAFAMKQHAYAAPLCGYANGNEYSSAPQAIGSLCAAGTPSSVSGSGPWSWTCTDGGSTNCVANRCGGVPAVPGACNTSTVNGCFSGSAINITSDTSNDYWYCSGSNGGANSSQCSKSKAPVACIPTGQPVPPGQTQCPTDACFFWVSGIQPSYRDNFGTYEAKIGSSSLTWMAGGTPTEFGTFDGVMAGSNMVGAGDYADAYGNDITPGPFYYAANGSFDGIAIGSNTRVTIYDGANFSGAVLFDQTGPLVVANKNNQSTPGMAVTPRNGWKTENWSSLGTLGAQFTSSTRKNSDEAPISMPANGPGLWRLSGIPAAAASAHNLIGSYGPASIKVSCSSPPVVGACNNSTVNSCSSGSAINTTSDAVNDYWYCSGSNGGANSPQCSKAKPPPAPVVGICNSTNVNGCAQGSAINITSDASNDYWYCSGSNGGANSPQCSKAKPITYTYAWTQSGFGACSATCGGGTQTQTVTCQRNDGASVADGFCSGGKPATSQGCNAQACIVPSSLPMTGTSSGNYAETSPTWYIQNVNGYRRSQWNASGQNPDVLMNAGCDGTIIHEENRTFRLSTGEYYNAYEGGDAGRPYAADLMDRYNGYCVGANQVAPDNENFQVHFRVYSGRYNSSGRRSEMNNEFASCLRTASAPKNCILHIYGVRP